MQNSSAILLSIGLKVSKKGLFSARNFANFMESVMLLTGKNPHQNGCRPNRTLEAESCCLELCRRNIIFDGLFQTLHILKLPVRADEVDKREP